MKKLVCASVLLAAVIMFGVRGESLPDQMSISAIIFEGDSNSAKGAGASSNFPAGYAPDGLYWERLGPYVPTNTAIYGYASSGDASWHILASIGAWTNRITTNKIEIVSVMTGANDLHRTNLVAAISNCYVLYDSLLALPGLDNLLLVGYMEYDVSFRNLNNAIRAYAESNGCFYVSIAECTAGSNGLTDRQKYTVGGAGGLHYNQLAHNVLADLIGEILAVASIDYDYDGLPNTWELQYFGGPTNANPDTICSNGINTVREAYITGLNPSGSFPASSALKTCSNFRSVSIRSNT